MNNLYANANPVTYSDPSGYFSLVESTVVTKIQSILSGLHHSAQIMKIMKWVDITCTVYDVAMQIREVYVAGGSMEDVLAALVHGVIVNFMIDGMCKTGLGVVLKPIMATVGLADQMDQVMEAFESRDPDEIVVRLLQLMTMTYGLTSQCFTGDTLVATEEGLREIATIEVGDIVWAEDTETGEKKLQKVLSVYVGETSTFVHVVTEGGTKIDTTESHPFYVEGEGWKAAAELQAGDILRGLDGKSQKVVSVEPEVLETPVQVYNLEVDEYHTYFVSADEVLVHNKYDAADGPSGSKGDIESGKGSKLQEVFDVADNYTLSDDTFNNHILDRHGPNSTYGNKSHFNTDFDIRDGIDSTLKGDNFVVGPNTAGREGYIFEQTFANPIGTNSKGKPLYTLKVVIDEAGNVITAFPKK